VWRKWWVGECGYPIKSEKPKAKKKGAPDE